MKIELPGVAELPLKTSELSDVNKRRKGTPSENGGNTRNLLLNLAKGRGPNRRL